MVPKWKPAAVNNTQEFQTLFEGNRQLNNVTSFWIYGTTDKPRGAVFNETDYRLDESGEKYPYSAKKNYKPLPGCQKVLVIDSILSFTSKFHFEYWPVQ